MSDLGGSFFSPLADQWREASLLGHPAFPSSAKCPVCHAQSLSATCRIIDPPSRAAVVNLTCSACKTAVGMQVTLPAGVLDRYSPDHLAQRSKEGWEYRQSMEARIHQHARTMPAAIFTTHPLWAKARWSATTFTWHPSSQAPPVMGLVFDDAEAGKEVFREAKRQMNHLDRFEEIRVSIIEGPVPGQEQRPGYSVHICPDPEALAAHATTEDFVLDRNIVPFLGQWNRMHPVPGSQPLLARFKEEYQKHKEYLLAPAVRREDGQLWFEPKLGIIKNLIEFRSLPEIAEGDVDAGALLLPQLIRPRPAEGGR